MYNIMNNSKTGMQANQSKIDIISNNIVNAQTSGYKKLEIDFIDLYKETLNRPSYPNNSDTSTIGTGVKVSQVTRNFDQGSLKETNIKTNLAIDGDGLFRVIRSDGSYAYTRNGEFNLDSSGRLVTETGEILDINFNNGLSYNNINLSNGEISINKLGEVFLNNQKVGNIDIYTSKGSNDIVPIGENLFIQAKDSEMVITNNNSIMQGYVELSNVNMQQEITELIMVQRAFQFNSKGINAIDQMWGMVNDLQGR